MEHAFAQSDYAGIVRRAFAFVLDLVAFSIAWFFSLVAITMADERVLKADDGAAFAMVAVPAFAWTALWIASPLRGSPGHLMVGIRVVRPDGSRVSFARAAGRALAEFATYALFALGVGVSGVMIVASQRRQAIHDLAADTVCVDRDALTRIGSPQHAPSPSQLAAPTARSAEPVIERRPVSTEERHRGPFL